MALHRMPRTVGPSIAPALLWSAACLPIFLSPRPRISMSPIQYQASVFSSSIDSFLTRHRIGVWRGVGAVVLIALLVGDSRWENSRFSSLLAIVGVLGVVAATIGRLWCALYISGRKSEELVVEGPYSMCRHPLYVCNFLGIAGLGAMTGSMIIVGFLVIAFALVYPAVIRSEDRLLARNFPSFTEYFARTPAFFPNRSLYRSERSWTVHLGSFHRNVADSIWFPLAALLFESLDQLHAEGILPTWILLG